MSTSRAVVSFLAAVAVLAGVPAAAAADASEGVDFQPAGDAQVLTVTFADTTPGPAIRIAATYRPVPFDSRAEGACADRLDANGDPRVIDETTPGGAYDIRRAITLPGGTYLVCLYRSGSLDQQPVPLYSSGYVSGITVIRGPASSLSISVTGRGGRARFSGKVTGQGSGIVELQRRRNGAFRTVARARIQNGRYRRTVAARRGQVWRARLPAAGPRPAIETRPVRLG